MSLLIRGLHNNGFSPIVNFYLKNQIVIGNKKGCYIFYDKNELNQKCKDIQTNIENNSNFCEDFRKKNDEIFDNLFLVCDKIKQTNLNKASYNELISLAKKFKDKITAGPLITVQLWGIEACWDDEYILSKEIKDKTTTEFEKIKGDLSHSTGQSVAFSERESFLNILNEMINNNPQIDSLILKHVNQFEWINSEYISKKLTFEQWKDLFSKETNIDASKELDNLRQTRKEAINIRNEVIKNLNLSPKAIHILNALNEFVAQRDWAKGKFCYALSIYDLLMQELGKRNKYDKNIFYYDIDEILERQSIGNRENFAIVSKFGDIKIYESDAVDEIIRKEKIGEIFSKITREREFKGVIANKGKITGNVRVIDNAKEIPYFKDGEIIVTYMTTMEFTPIFKKAKGIITDEGGLSSHAAIIAREFSLPCIVGTKIATRTLKTGDLVELDANSGKITILNI